MAEYYAWFVAVASMGEVDVDWLETDDHLILTVDVPGLKKEDLSMQVFFNNVLQIAGVRHGVDSPTDAFARALERPRDMFLRQYRLPDNALLERLQAYDMNGVLTIIIPKLKSPMPSIPSSLSKL